MRTKLDDHLPQPVLAQDAGGSQLWARKLARVLLPLIVTIVTVQPMAWAAPATSLLLQTPTFLDGGADSNVLLLMDDSESMNGWQLPPPTGVVPQAANSECPVAGQVKVSVGGVLTCVARQEWLYRSPALNPLYYNPAITYLPWNNNGASTFTNADTGVRSNLYLPASPTANPFREGLIRHDMRFKGPNRPQDSLDTTALNTATGSINTHSPTADPSILPGVDYTRDPKDWAFRSVQVTISDSPRNYDIFSSPPAKIGALQCTPSTSKANFDRGYNTRTSTDATPQPRPSVEAGYVVRTTFSQDAQARTRLDQPSFLYQYNSAPTERNIQNRPTVARTTSPIDNANVQPVLVAPIGVADPSTNTPLSSAAQGTSNRSTSLQPQFNRAVVDRTFVTITSTAQTYDVRTTDDTLEVERTIQLLSVPRDLEQRTVQWTREEGGTRCDATKPSSADPPALPTADPSDPSRLRPSDRTGNQNWTNWSTTKPDPELCQQQGESGREARYIWRLSPCGGDKPDAIVVDGVPYCAASCGSNTANGGNCTRGCAAPNEIETLNNQQYCASPCNGRTEVTDGNRLLCRGCTTGFEETDKPGGGRQCISVCSANSVYAGSGTLGDGTRICYKNCGSGTSNGGVLGAACVTTCTATGQTLATVGIVSVCYQACTPSGTNPRTPLDSDISKCARACNTSAGEYPGTLLGSQVCWQSCPSGSLLGPLDSYLTNGTQSAALTCYSNTCTTDNAPTLGVTAGTGSPPICLNKCTGATPTLLPGPTIASLPAPYNGQRTPGVCVGACPNGTIVDSGGGNYVCTSSCPTGSSFVGGKCVTCPTGYSPEADGVGTYQCRRNCGADEVLLSLPTGDVCVSSASCNGTPVNEGATVRCLNACSSPELSVSVGDVPSCYSNCPDGWSKRGDSTLFTTGLTGSQLPSVGLCYQNCSAGQALTVTSGGVQACGSCSEPVGTNRPAWQYFAGATQNFCRRASCPTNQLSSLGTNGQQFCYDACSTLNTSTQSFVQGKAANGKDLIGECRSTCTGDYTHASTNEFCYKACPTGSSQDPLGVCLPDCPVERRGTVDGQAVCYRTCDDPNYPNFIGNRCYASCGTGNEPITVDGVEKCRASCDSNSEFDGVSRCLSNCVSPGVAGTRPHPTTPGLTIDVCYTQCPSGSTTNSITSGVAATCFGCNPATLIEVTGGTCCPKPTDPASVQAALFSPAPQQGRSSSSSLLTSRSGSSVVRGSAASVSINNTTTSDAEGANCPPATSRPSGFSCIPDTYVPDLRLPSLARYYRFVPVATDRSPTNLELGNPANYELVEINRDKSSVTYDKPYTDNDPTKARAQRTDCGTGTTCTTVQEMQNFANWFTYYRTRQLSAISVASAALNELTESNNRLDRLRIGFGAINYAPGEFNAYSGGTWADTAANFKIDNVRSPSAVVRGVRPFLEGTTDRQQVFNWLFALQGVGATPNREALDSAGRYFLRADKDGPWATTPGNGGTEDPASHLPCRRNYTILITDGEWTNSPSGQQPTLMSLRTFPPVDTMGTSRNVTANSAPEIGGTSPYVPANESQFSGLASTKTSNASVDENAKDVVTMTDVALLYWSRDLRTDLENRLSSTTANPASWQHMVPYIVGYGISASMDSADVRNTKIPNRQTVSWPPVAFETRPGILSIVTDRDVAITGDNIAFNCAYDATSNPSGCGRVNDTFRAAMAGRGNFFTAADVSSLAQSLQQAFDAIAEITGSGTPVTGRSATVAAGDRVYVANFTTNRWTGRLQAYDAESWAAAAAAGTTPATPVVSSFPQPTARNILTSASRNDGGRLFPDTQTEFDDPTAATPSNSFLTTTQRTQLTSWDVANWLRGERSKEAAQGGTLRTRFGNDIMADVVNSAPRYSRNFDAGYRQGRLPSAAPAHNTAPYYNINDANPGFVQQNTSLRPATVFVGANGGMLHAFDARPKIGSVDNADFMKETFAYVPRATYPNLASLASPGYLHRYYVDGPVVEGDVYVNNKWRTVLVGASGAGPKSIFALDVTQHNGTAATAMSASNVLWDIAPDIDGVTPETNPNRHIGHITQPGVIGSGPDGRWYYFVGNGYESASDDAALLAIDIADGTVKVFNVDSSANPDSGGNIPNSSTRLQRPNGLGGITPVYDSKRDIVAIYAGDRLGRLFKFTLSGQGGTDTASCSPSTTCSLQVTSTLLFDTAQNTGEGGSTVNAGQQIEASAGNWTTVVGQPITAAPRVARHPLGGRLVIFGTGRLTEGRDAKDDSLQTIYAIWERDVANPSQVAFSDVYQGLSLQEVVLAGTGTTPSRKYRVLVNASKQSLNWGTHKGWKIDLRAGTTGRGNGERVVATPVDNAGFVSIVSFTPSALSGQCAGGGSSFFYRFDVAGNFTRDAFRDVSLTVPGATPGETVNVPRNTIVGEEIEGTVAPVTLVTRAGVLSTSTPQTTLTSAEQNALLTGSRPPTDPCANTRGVANTITAGTDASSATSCANPALRVWQNLPGGPLR